MLAAVTIRHARHALAAVATLAGLATAAAAPGDGALGARLFDGRAPMEARLAGRDVALPVNASRCTNCHRRDGPARAASAGELGPALTAAALRTRQPRRGGPASAYDGGAFCRVLRTGVDPAQVIIDLRMPRYAASDAECAALWAYLGGSS
jgi:hypothetical protein